MNADEVSWVRVEWDGPAGEPAVLHSALNSERFEVRKVEEFGDGRVGFTESFVRTTSTRLGSAAIPEPAEINEDRQFRASTISQEQFESAWASAVDTATRSGDRFRCRCCGSRCLEETALGTYEICPICGWEDDPVQSADIERTGGANGGSLRDQRRSHLEQALQQHHWHLGQTHGRPAESVIIDGQALEVEAAMTTIAQWMAIGDSIGYEAVDHGGEAAIRLTRQTD